MTAKLRTLAAGVVVTAAVLLPAVAGTAQATPEAATNPVSVSPRAACNDFSTFSLSGNRVHIPSIGHQTHATDCTLRNGNTGAGVFVLQGALRVCYQRAIEQDADYGPLTEEAVKYVQRKHGLADDGIYGPDTRNAMRFPQYNARGVFVRC